MEAPTIFPGHCVFALESHGSCGPIGCVRSFLCCPVCAVVSVVQCHNTGEDDRGDAQWKCESNLEDTIKLGEITVSCEGFSSRTDRLKLRGSCGLEYSLHYTPKVKTLSSSVDHRTKGCPEHCVGRVQFRPPSARTHEAGPACRTTALRPHD